MANSLAKFYIPLLAVLGFCLSATWALRNPMFEAPDEPLHVAYINYLLKKGHLPVQESNEQLYGEGHQHPLYYVAGAGLLRATGATEIHVQGHPQPSSNPPRPMVPSVSYGSQSDEVELYGLRLFNSLLMGASVWLLALMSRRLISGPSWVIPPLLLATLPQVGFISGAVNNDAATLLCGVGAFSSIALAFLGEGSWLAAGIWCGIGFLVKKSMGECCALGALFVLWPQHRKSWWLFYLPMLAGVLPILIRNGILYHELLGSGMEERTVPGLVHKKSLFSPYWMTFTNLVWRSSIGLFGWMNVLQRGAIYVVWTLIVLPAFLAFQAPKSRTVLISTSFVPLR